MNHAALKILIVEDDPTMLRGLRDSFAQASYTVYTATEGEAGLDLALELDPHLILLDVMLPGINGYEIVRHLRAEGKTTPVLLLTARDEESDILLGLGLGADDYVTKPFRVRELHARCEAILRRTGSGEAEQASGSFDFGDFQLDTLAHQLRNAEGEEVELSPKEYDLLLFFLQNSGRACGREEIMNAVWGYGSSVTLRSIDRFVTGLRKKIDDPADAPQWIQTIRQFGYKFTRPGT